MADDVRDVILREWSKLNGLEAMHAALDQLHAQQQRIIALEQQLKAAREEIRRYVAERMSGE